MAIAAKISPAELTSQVTSRFDGAYLEGRLINAPGVAYVPGTTDDASFLTFEVTPGTAGYQRQVIGYEASDVSAYSDDGVAQAPGLPSLLTTDPERHLTSLTSP